MNGPRIRRGTEPLVVAVAHGGTDLAGLDDQFISPARALLDTDWWIEDLYAFAADMGATLIANDISRSIVDMNRDPSGASLYPGQATTELGPSTTFDGAPLYRFGVPDEAEITRRLQQYHRPYHEALSAELARLRDAHGRVVRSACWFVGCIRARHGQARSRSATSAFHAIRAATNQSESERPEGLAEGQRPELRSRARPAYELARCIARAPASDRDEEGL